MPGSIALNTVLNNYAGALGNIDQLEKLLEQAMGAMRELKEGTKALDDLVITENGWEFKDKGASLNGKDNSNAVKATKVMSNA
jgi:hypothetical protein